MRKGQLLHVLQHQNPLVAVALLNPSAVITAVADKAILWQGARAKRIFQAPAVSVSVGRTEADCSQSWNLGSETSPGILHGHSKDQSLDHQN
jgi:hypothetical protein